MKMHPKPAKRHTQYVEPFSLTSGYYGPSPDAPFHISFKRLSDEATQLLTMNREEAIALFEQLGVMLRYEDTPISVVDTEDWTDMQHMMKSVRGFR